MKFNTFRPLAVLAVIAIMLSVSVALARGAPPENAFTDQAIVSVDVAPTVANVPPVTVGYDVIQNITPAFPRLANANQDSDTSGARGLSPTVDWRARHIANTMTAPHVANVQASGRGTGTALRRQSTTGDERNVNATALLLSRANWQPDTVLLA